MIGSILSQIVALVKFSEAETSRILLLSMGEHGNQITKSDTLIFVIQSALLSHGELLTWTRISLKPYIIWDIFSSLFCSSVLMFEILSILEVEFFRENAVLKCSGIQNTIPTQAHGIWLETWNPYLSFGIWWTSWKRSYSYPPWKSPFHVHSIKLFLAQLSPHRSMEDCYWWEPNCRMAYRRTKKWCWTFVIQFLPIA